MAETGRPSKFTPEVREIILEAVEEGNYFSVACSIAGVKYSTFKTWMRRGNSTAEGDAEFSAFRTAIKRAQAQGEQKRLKCIIDESSTTWQAAAWFLERKYPKRWGRPAASPPKPWKPLKDMNQAELDAYEALVESSRTR